MRIFICHTVSLFAVFFKAYLWEKMYFLCYFLKEFSLIIQTPVFDNKRF